MRPHRGRSSGAGAHLLHLPMREASAGPWIGWARRRAVQVAARPSHSRSREMGRCQPCRDPPDVAGAFGAKRQPPAGTLVRPIYVRAAWRSSLGCRCVSIQVARAVRVRDAERLPAIAGVDDGA